MAPLPPIHIDLPVDTEATALAAEALTLCDGDRGPDERWSRLADDLTSGRRVVAHPRIPDLAHLPEPTAREAVAAALDRSPRVYSEGYMAAALEAATLVDEVMALDPTLAEPGPVPPGPHDDELEERVVAGFTGCAVQDEQAPGLAGAVSLLVEVLGKHDVDQPVDEWDDHDLDELHTAADAVAFVFHRLPVEGWHHLPTIGRQLDLAAALARVLAEGGSDAYLVDAVPARLVVDPGLTVAVSAEEAESIRNAGATVIPDAGTRPQDGVPLDEVVDAVVVEAPRALPPTDLPGAGNVARPDAP